MHTAQCSSHRLHSGCYLTVLSTTAKHTNTVLYVCHRVRFSSVPKHPEGYLLKAE